MRLDQPKNLLSHIDLCQTKLQPLAKHYVTHFDKHTCESYATLLTAVLFSNVPVTEAQSRMHQMLLGSMKLTNAQARLIEQAQSLEADELFSIQQLLDTSGLAYSFLLDAMILSRLDNPLGDSQCKLISALLDLFQVPDDEAKTLISLAGYVLGLHGRSDATYLDFSNFEPWCEFIFKKLSPSDQSSTMDSGYYIVDGSVSLTDVTKIKNSYFRFEKNNWLITVRINHKTLNRMFQKDRFSPAGNYQIAFRHPCVADKDEVSKIFESIFENCTFVLCKDSVCKSIDATKFISIESY